MVSLDPLESRNEIFILFFVVICMTLDNKKRSIQRFPVDVLIGKYPAL